MCQTNDVPCQSRSFEASLKGQGMQLGRVTWKQAACPTMHASRSRYSVEQPAACPESTARTNEKNGPNGWKKENSAAPTRKRLQIKMIPPYSLARMFATAFPWHLGSQKIWK